MVISYRSDENEGNATIHAIKQLNRKGKCFFADFSHTEGIERFFQQALDYLGGIHILVNNAAGYDTSPFLDLHIDTFEHLIKVGVSAPMLLIQLAARNMIQNQCAGAIINVSSRISI